MADMRKFAFEKEGMQGLCEALCDEDIHMRRMAAHFLGTTGDTQVIPNLIDAFQDPDKMVRAGAMDALVAIGSPAVEDLIEALQKDDWVMRYRVAEALGRIADERTIEPLLGCLGDRKDHVRYIGAKGLGISGEMRAVPEIIPLLSDENEFVRRSAATALGELGGEAAFEALEASLSGETSERVQDIITSALEQMKKE